MTNTSPGLTAALSLKNGEGYTDRSFSFSKEKVGLRLFCVLALLLAACTSHTAKNDADTVAPDSDIPLLDDAVVVDDTTVADDVVAVVDEDEATDTLLSDDGIPDEDTFCPSLEKVELPFRDAENNIHFCRPCDLPAKTDDPKCVRNLWDTANKKLATDYPAVDCYPYPCVIEGMVPSTNNPILIEGCDVDVAPYGTNWGTTYGGITYKHYALNEGQLAWTMGRHYGINQGPDYSLNYPTASTATLFDISTKKYRAIFALDGEIIGYKNGIYVSLVEDFNKVKDVESDKTSPNFLIAYDDMNGYRPIFNDAIADYTMNAFMSDKWVIAHFTTVKGMMTVQYAKIGEWDWHFFSGGLEYIASMSGDMLGYHTESFEGYVCDLSKTPRYATDCLKVNRGDEQVVYVTMDKANPKRFAFSPLDTSPTTTKIMYLGEIVENNTITYTELPVGTTEVNKYAVVPYDFSGNAILYSEVFTPEGSSENDAKICFYTISDKRRYCPPDRGYRYNMGKAEFEDKWMVWQGYDTTTLHARDLECYCGKYPDSCPPGLVTKK